MGFIRHFCEKSEKSDVRINPEIKDDVDRIDKLDRPLGEKPVPKFDPYYKYGIPREYLRLATLGFIASLAFATYFYLKPPDLTAEQKDKIMHFFAKLNADPDVTVTYTGLMYKIKRETPLDADDAKGFPSSKTDTALINYRSKFMNGEVFDSTFEFSPCSFNLPDIIEGLGQGIAMMRPGDIYEFYIPDHLAYGSRGSKFIGSYEPLIFEVELLDFWETPQSDNIYVRLMQTQNIRMPWS